ncbi:MAG: pyridoxamine 5'-phosphate oxidase family protein [Alphaproteobacteria bacterium]|nr:MAG: pyridoxamine 5'-phosphate oxidase family protein [Alphaproteobacteria bacterium]
MVVFRTGEGTKLQLAVMVRVAFEVDDWDAATGVGWSVVIKGVAEEITSGIDPFAMALRSRRVVPLAPGVREYWIAVYPSEITGRRFGRV